MEDEETTNQVVDEGATETDTQPTDGVEPQEQQFDDDGNPIEEAEVEEDEEIDLDEETKLKLPKSQAEKLRQAMLRQADYTRKTQELAEARKSFETERQAISQADETELTARANLTLIERQLATYQQVNWQQLNEQDPFEAQKHFQQFTLLKDAKQQTETYLGTLRQERSLQTQQETAKRMEQGAAELARDIGWTPEKAKQVGEFAKKAYGLTSDDLDGIDDPRAIKILHAAYQWEQHQAKTKKAQSHVAAQQAQPAAKASGSRNPVPPGRLDDRLSADEWMKRRNAQLRRA